jgi:hypothetical protein
MHGNSLEKAEIQQPQANTGRQTDIPNNSHNDCLLDWLVEVIFKHTTSSSYYFIINLKKYYNLKKMSTSHRLLKYEYIANTISDILIAFCKV